jgi:hypothetical protein
MLQNPWCREFLRNKAFTDESVAPLESMLSEDRGSMGFVLKIRFFSTGLSLNQALGRVGHGRSSGEAS